MSIDPRHGRFCDECGRTIDAAVRVYQGKDYCRGCYQRTFLPVPCSECGSSTRQHRHAVGAPVCDRCTRSRRTCLRCGKLTFVAGKLVGRSAVCASCAPRFNDKRPCSACGRESNRLTRPLFAGQQDAVCDSCRNKINHATCSVCRRYRPISCRDTAGAVRCASCVPGNEVVHVCPGCGSVERGGGLGHCRPCLNRFNVEKDAALVASSIDSAWCRELWYGYAQASLQPDAGSPRLRARINRSADFFRALDRLFDSSDEVTADTLAQRMDARFLRSYLTAYRYVIGHLDLAGVESARAEQAEAHRTSKILQASADLPYGSILNAYVQWLQCEGISSRTARMYLRAAESFFRVTSEDGAGPWPPEALVDYLKRTPGNAANVGRFVRYCRRHLGWDVDMPDKALWRRSASRINQDVRALRAAMQSSDERPVASLSTKEVARVLSLALGIPAAQLLRRRAMVPISRFEDGSIEIDENAIICTTHPLYAFAQRWTVLADAYLNERRPEAG